MNAKRIVSLVLTAAVILGLLGTGAVTAFAAEDTVIDYIEVTITGVEEGKSTDGVTITVPEGAPYTVRLNGAGIYDDSDSMTPFTGIFGKDIYRVDVYVEPKAGYSFTEDAEYVIKGDGVQFQSAFLRESNAYGLFAQYDFTIPIDHVEVTITGVEEGKSSADVTISGPAGANYQVRTTPADIRDNDDTTFTGTFGKDYYSVYIDVVAQEGYRFEDSVELTVTGDAHIDSHIYSIGQTLYGFCVAYDFRTPIDKVELTVTGIEEGKSSADVKVTVPEGANYGLEELYILDSDWDDFTGTFGKDGYTAESYLTPATGYSFTEDTQVTVNGGEPDYLNVQKDYCDVGYTVDLRTPIDKVDITVTGMEEGKSSADVKVTFPEGANYGLEELYITDSNWDEFTGTFGKDSYFANISLEPAEGYYFAENVQVTVNGIEPEYLDTASGYIYAEYEADFRIPITRIDLPNWPTVAVGGEIPKAEIVTPEGKHYMYVSQVLEYLPDGSLEETSGTYRNDTVYAVVVIAQAAEGYTLAKDVTVTVGGKTYTGVVENMGNGLAIMKLFPLGDVKVVDKITLSAEQPTAGKAPSQITSTGTGYTMKNAYWGVANNGDASNVDEPGETFQVGEYVYMALVLKLDEGYVFDPNTKIWLGDKSYDLVPDYSRIDDDEVFLVICLGQLKAPVNPSTGDHTPVVALAVLTLASILGMGLVISRRKAI